MKAVPKLLRLLSRRSALAALPPPPHIPLRRLLGPAATPPPAVPACYSLPCCPAATLPSSASAPRPGNSHPSIANLVGEAAPPPPTTTKPSLRPGDYLKCGDAEESCSLLRLKFMATPAPALHRRPPCAGLAPLLSRFRGLGFTTPRAIVTPWRYPGSRSFSTDGTRFESEQGDTEKAVDYFKKHNILHQVPDFTAGCHYNLITPNPDQPFMLNESAKRSFRSLLKRIDSLHMKHKCISTEILKSNIQATSNGVLVFSDVKTEILTEAMVKKNYSDLRSCFVSIITELYGEEVFSRNHIPHGFSHLIDAMVDDNLDKSYVLPNHLSLLPISTRSVAVLKIYMLLLEQMPKRSAKLKATAMGILREAAQPYLVKGNDWYDMAKSDPMLNRWLSYRGGRLYTRSEKSFLELHRHVTHHCMEHINTVPVGNYTYESVQALLEHKYGKFLPRCQFGLWDENLLKPLKLHTLFTSPPEPYSD